MSLRYRQGWRCLDPLLEIKNGRIGMSDKQRVMDAVQRMSETATLSEISERARYWPRFVSVRLQPTRVR